jgi:hypothetical protein
VNTEVGLAIAIEIELAQGHTACHRLLVNPGRHGPPAPQDLAWETTIDRHEIDWT